MAPTVRGLPSHPLSRTPSSRVEVDAFAVGERPHIEALTSAPAQIAAPGVAVGVGPGGLDQRLEFGEEGPGLLFDGFGFNLHWPKLEVDLYVPALVSGIFGTQAWVASEFARQAAGRNRRRKQRSRRRW